MGNSVPQLAVVGSERVPSLVSNAPAYSVSLTIHVVAVVFMNLEMHTLLLQVLPLEDVQLVHVIGHCATAEVGSSARTTRNVIVAITSISIKSDII